MDEVEFTQRTLQIEYRLYRVSRAILKEPQDQMDAVQEAIARAWRRRDSLRQPQFFETWLTRILIHSCYDQLRHKKRTVSIDELPELVAPEECNSELRDALDSLDEKLRLPVILFYIEGYRCREIAQILGISDGAVRERLCHARKKLRKLLGDEEDGHEA